MRFSSDTKNTHYAKLIKMKNISELGIKVSLAFSGGGDSEDFEEEGGQKGG